MRIGVDTRELTKNKAGKGWYVFHVLTKFKDIDKKNEYFLYGNEETEFPEWPESKKIVIGGSDLLWHWKVAQRLARDGINLFWAPTSPIVPYFANVPTVMTIHDLTNILFPDTHTTKGKIIDKLFLKKALKKTRHIITISEATKKDLIKYCPETKNKISVTLLGYDTLFKPLSNQETEQKIEKYKLQKGYVLYVGTIEPRKNIINLMRAYKALPANLKSKHPLVLVGKKGWLSEPIFEAMKEPFIADDIKYLEYVPFEDLPAIYNGAKVFVFPSLYEGFGLPPLEAMACGTPVITGNTSSLPEVVGKAGFLVSPNDTDTLKSKMRFLLTDETARQQYSKLGIEQSAQFSWSNTARQTLDILQF